MAVSGCHRQNCVQRLFSRVKLEQYEKSKTSLTNKAAVNLKTGRFDHINLAVIISSVCKAVQNCKSLTVKVLPPFD